MDRRLTFARITDRDALRRVLPHVVRELEVVQVEDGLQLHARLQNSDDEWVLTSTGGAIDTVPASDRDWLHQVAQQILSCTPRTF